MCHRSKGRDEGLYESLLENTKPVRIIHGFQRHPVGGVGTPWWLKASRKNIEVACLAAGCNLRCPQCQNLTTSYLGKGNYITPEEAAFRLTEARIREGVNRMAISGGEATLVICQTPFGHIGPHRSDIDF